MTNKNIKTLSLAEENAQKILDIREKIKAFTKVQPSMESILDMDYQTYLAQCEKLLKFDVKMNSLLNLEFEPEDTREILSFIENEVTEIVSTRL